MFHALNLEKKTNSNRQKYNSMNKLTFFILYSKPESSIRNGRLEGYQNRLVYHVVLIIPFNQTDLFHKVQIGFA